MKKAVLFCLLALALMSCQFVTIIEPTATPDPTSTVTSTRTTTFTPQPTVTLTPTPQTDCDPNVFIEALKPYVPYETFTLSYQIYQGTRYIYFWIVDPELDPLATESELSQNFDLAVRHSIDLAQLLNRTDACVAEYFDYFNPIVVDSNYNGWFSGGIDISLLPEGNLSEEDYQVIQDAIMDYGAWERTFVPQVQSIPEESCTWDEVLEITSMHFYTATLNTYMLVVDNNGVTFTVQYASRPPIDALGDSIVVFMNSGRAIGCLLPPVNIVNVLIVDEYGNMLDYKSYPLQ